MTVTTPALAGLGMAGITVPALIPGEPGSRLWRACAAVCRSWAAAAQHGAQAARHHGREPAGAMGARGWPGMAGPAGGPGGCIMLGLPVPVRGPGLRQVVQQCGAHRGLLGGV